MTPDQIREVALRVACEIGVWNPGDKNALLDPEVFAQRLIAEIQKASKPVAWLIYKDDEPYMLDWYAQDHRKSEPLYTVPPAPADVDINPETFLRLIKTIKYMVGIAEKGRGYKCPDDVLPERFLLEYVIELEPK